MTAKRSVAPGWEKWNGPHRTQWRPVVDWLLRHARVDAGMRVLDIACGTGQPAIPAAEKVRPGGRVVGVDTDTEMLAACSRLARQAGIDNLDLQQMDMHALNFPEASFDAVTFGFGLMFAKDPVKVMLEVRRVLKPGGYFALAVWGDPKRNAMFTATARALEALGQPAPDPKAPGPFRLAPHGELQSVIRAAGFADFSVESAPFHIDAATPDQMWEMMTDMNSVLSAALADAPPEVVAKSKQAFVDEAGTHLHEGRVHLPATPLCAAAMR
jgi:SAM-dependent methyltransferase